MNTKYIIVVLLFFLHFSCSNDEGTPAQVETNQEILDEEEEPNDDPTDNVFTDTEATDWFFYQNEDISPGMKIRSVMASRDSTLILEAYSDSDDYTSSILFKEANVGKTGMFKIKDGSPDEFFLVDEEVSNQPNFSVGMKDGYSELYYHIGDNDESGQKLLLLRFTLSEVNGEIQLTEVEPEESSKSIGFDSECDSDLGQYEGTELCLAYTRKYWCVRHGNWKNKLPAFALAAGAQTVPTIGSFDIVRGRIGTILEILNLQDDVQELLEEELGETLSQYLSGMNSMGQTFNSFIFKDIIKEGIVNGYCDTYDFRLSQTNYLIYTEPITPTEIVSFIYPIDYSTDVQLVSDGDPTIVGWSGESLSNTFKAKLVANDGVDVPDSYQASIVWNIENFAVDVSQNYTFGEVNLNQTSTYSPRVPDIPGDYYVSAYLTTSPEKSLSYILRVTEEEIVVIVHSSNPYGAYEFADQFPDIHNLEVSASVYSNRGWGSIAFVYLEVDNWGCCPNNSFSLSQFSGFNTVGEVTNSSKHVALNFKASFGETNGAPVTLRTLCARVSLFSVEKYCAP